MGGFYGGSSTTQFIACTSQGNSEGFILLDGATVTDCKDVGSSNGFTTTDHGSITLTNCWSDQAQQWALHALSSHDVTATNFKVTNPVGNPYPAILAGSPMYPSTNMNIQLAETTATTPLAPVALFKASVTSGKAPLTVQFTDRSTGEPTSFLWKFGDGTTSTEQNPNHIYTKRGIFTVTETVKNSAGSNTKVKTRLITVR
jgi:FOG: PKD repeat